MFKLTTEKYTNEIMNVANNKINGNIAASDIDNKILPDPSNVLSPQTRPLSASLDILSERAALRILIPTLRFLLHYL